MKVKWLVENFIGDTSYDDLVKAIRAQGMECDLFGVKHHFEFDVSKYQNQCIVFQGSIQMTNKMIKDLTNCFPIAYSTQENYQCHKYYPYLSDFLFNDRYVLVPWGDLKKNVFLFYGIFAKEAIMFIRPDSGEKPFAGGLIDLQDFPKFYENRSNGVKLEELVLISSPKNIRGEYRFIVTKYENRIIGHSTYQYQGQKTLIPAVPNGAYDKAQEVLNAGYHPDSVFTIDIAEDSDGKFWLLELNSFSSAGLYAANKGDIVREVSKIAEMEYKELECKLS